MLPLNKPLLVLSLLLISSAITHAQTIQDQEKVILSSGFGYYDPFRTGEKGNLFYSKILFKAKNEIYIGFGFETSLTFNEYDEFSYFIGNRFYEAYYLYNLHFEKYIYIGKHKNHIIGYGTGIVYEQQKSSIPYITTITNRNGKEEIYSSFVYVSDEKQSDAGTFFELNYKYKRKNIGIGLRLKGHVLLNIGFSGLIINPTISVSI